MGRPLHKLAATTLRVLIAWLLVMQPMIGAHAAAQAANTPFALELCRGVPAPVDGTPAKTADHQECCLACTPTAAPPPVVHSTVGPSARFAAAAAAPRAENIVLRRTGLSPHAARAPPL
jgi:hypothetical protein